MFPKSKLSRKLRLKLMGSRLFWIIKRKEKWGFCLRKLRPKWKFPAKKKMREVLKNDDVTIWERFDTIISSMTTIRNTIWDHPTQCPRWGTVFSLLEVATSIFYSRFLRLKFQQFLDHISHKNLQNWNFQVIFFF